MAQPNLDNLARLARENGHPFKILIVDDEPWVRDVFKDFCELTDAFEVDVAASGAEAVSRVSKAQYDLVTLDIIMPEMSGLEALGEIKKIAPRTPVMVVTGNATEKLIKEAGILGACQVLYKPIMLEEFMAVLHTTLADSKQL